MSLNPRPARTVPCDFAKRLSIRIARPAATAQLPGTLRNENKVRSREGCSYYYQAEKMRYLQMRNSPERTAVRLLRKGQRWKMADCQMRIYHVGVHLVEFRMFKVSNGVPQQKLGRSSLETVEFVQNYLEKHEAVLGNE